MIKESKLTRIQGLGPASITKLKENGIITLLNLATQNPTELNTLTGISEKLCRKFINEANTKSNLGFDTANNYFDKKKANKLIGTGCEVFDTMIGGGFEPGYINEVHGKTGISKSQLTHLMVVRGLLGNKTNKTIYIDSENSFSKNRIEDFAKANGLDTKDAFKRIKIARAYNFDNQMLLINKVEEMVQKDPTYKLLVIDSLTAHIRNEFAGRGRLADRQAKLNKHMHDIMRIADLYNLVVIVTNQILSDPSVVYANPDKPVGGNILSHNCGMMIYLRPGLKGCTHAIVVDSTKLPKNECNYFIRTGGFEAANT